MADLTEHLDSEKFKLFFEYSKRKKNLSEKEKFIFDNIDRHISNCPVCKNEYEALKNIYFDQISVYKRRKYVRNSFFAASLSVLLIYVFFIPKSELDNKSVDQLTYSEKGDVNDKAMHVKGDVVSADSDSTSESIIIPEGSSNADNSEITQLDNNSKIEDESDSLTLLDLLNSYSDTKLGNPKISLLEHAVANNFELPPSFVEDELQEIQINESYLRSHNEDIKIEPPNLSIMKVPINFRWNINSGEVRIVVKDNNNQKVWEKSFNEIKEYTFEEKLPAGLYYWDVRLNNRVKQKNKFFLLN